MRQRLSNHAIIWHRLYWLYYGFQPLNVTVADELEAIEETLARLQGGRYNVSSMLDSRVQRHTQQEGEGAVWKIHRGGEGSEVLRGRSVVTYKGGGG